MRTIGIGALGLIGGVLSALVVQDLLAVAFVREGTVPDALVVVLALLMPVMALLGVVVAVLLDRQAKRRANRTPRG